MPNYKNVEQRASKALDAVTPVLLFATRTPGSVGWRCYNPSSTQDILYKCQKSSDAAPTHAEMLIECTYRGTPQGTIDDAGEACNVYASVVSGTLTVYPEELF